MTKEQERAELHRTIWNIAKDLRGSVDGWDFKAYVLGMLFYRFISENITNYVNRNERKAGSSSFNYANLSDEKAESGRGIVLRAFESANKHKTARLTFGFAVKRIFETDLMEKDIAEIAVKDNAVSLCFKPFEIKTLRIET